MRCRGESRQDSPLPRLNALQADPQTRMRFFFLSSHAHYALDPGATRVSGGAELQVALLAKELVDRGHEVVIAGGDTGQQDGRVFNGVVTRNAGRFHTGGMSDAVTALPKVAGLLAEYRPEYVCVLGWTAWLYILCLLRPIFGYKLVFICGLDTEIDGSFGKTHGWKGGLFERGVAHSDFRFAMSEHQRGLFGRGGLSCGMYRNLILPRANPRTATKDIDLLWVGRCQHIKRPHLFLDLVERLPDTRCEMICPREDEELWQSVVARAAGIPNLTFHERVPYAEIQETYDRARFLVSTSEAEGFPNVMIQAAQGAAGILSLELDPDGLIETFGAGFSAGGDVELFVAKTRELIAGSEISQRMGDGAQKMVSEWLDNAKNTEAFLEGLK
jgi:glycosyltransferase involved in cell wall biosynthesis